MVKTVFDLYKVKQKFCWDISSFLAFKKIKEYVPPCHRLQKVCRKKNFVADFRVTVQIFNTEKRKFQDLILEFGLGTKITPPFCTILHPHIHRKTR